MENEKRQIRITINDLDNIEDTLNAIDLLFKNILIYWIDKKEDEKAIKFVGGGYIYFKRLLELFGINTKEVDKHYEDEELL